MKIIFKRITKNQIYLTSTFFFSRSGILDGNMTSIEGVTDDIRGSAGFFSDFVRSLFSFFGFKVLEDEIGGVTFGAETPPPR